MGDTTKWIMLLLLLLLIGLAVFFLLRRPGDTGDAAVDAREGTDGTLPQRTEGHGALDRSAEHTTGTDPMVSAAGAAGVGGAAAATAAPYDQAADDRGAEHRVEEHRVDDQQVEQHDAPMAETATYDETSTYDAPVEETATYQETSTYDAPVEETATYQETSTYDAPVEETATYDETTEHDSAETDDSGRWREAAAIGAMGAAGGAAVASRSSEDDTRHTDAEATGEVHSLTDEEMEQGARHEPLPMDEQTPAEEVSGIGHDGHDAHTGHDTSADHDAYAGDEAHADHAAADADHTAYPQESATHAEGTGEVRSLTDEEMEQGARHEPLTADEVVAAHGTDAGQEEYPVGDSSTTYRADEGGAVAVDETHGAPEQQMLPQEESYTDDGRPADADGSYVDSTGGADGGSWASDDRGDVDRGDGTYDSAPVVEETESTYVADESGSTFAEERHETTYAGDGTGYADDRADTTYAGDEAQTGYVDQATTESTYSAGETQVEDPALSGGDEARVDEPAYAAGGAAAPVFAESVYGAGSAEPQEDGSGPAGWEVKGNAGSMLFHTPDSPSWDGVRAEVWFESEEAARAAGFAHWDRRRR